MSTDLSHQTVGGLVAERPSRSRLFERWGIDYCCGGKQPLVDSCAALSIDLHAVLRELQDEATEEIEDQTDWTTAPLSALISHIVTTHHDYLREALPRLSILTEKVRDAHAQRHPELVEIATVFAVLRTNMEAHTEKEEQVDFPSIAQLEAAEALPVLACGTIHNPIQVLEKEHENAGAALETLHRLTNGYTVPEDVCATYRAMLEALAQLETDTHQHVHKENNILFPRAEAREMQLTARHPV